MPSRVAYSSILCMRPVVATCGRVRVRVNVTARVRVRAVADRTTRAVIKLRAIISLTRSPNNEPSIILILIRPTRSSCRLKIARSTKPGCKPQHDRSPTLNLDPVMIIGLVPDPAASPKSRPLDSCLILALSSTRSLLITVHFLISQRLRSDTTLTLAPIVTRSSDRSTITLTLPR